MQVIEEERHYRILASGPDVSYGAPSVEWTYYVENHLKCYDCEWTVSMESEDARNLLGE